MATRPSKPNIFICSFAALCGSCSVDSVLTRKPDRPLSHDFSLDPKEIVPPKPVKRKRALTLPLETGFVQRWRGARKEPESQLECALFKLPAELRVVVYEEYFGNGICLFLGNGRLCAYQAKLSRGYPLRLPDVLPLLLTCRRIYSESISLLYSTPTFYFYTTPAFMTFYGSILSQRNNAIRSVKFDFTRSQSGNKISPSDNLRYSNIKSQCQTHSLLLRLSIDSNLSMWNACCIILSQMASLKEVKVEAWPEIFEPGHFGWTADESLLRWLERLKEKKVDMDVHVNGRVREIRRDRYMDRRWVWKVNGGEEWLEQN